MRAVTAFALATALLAPALAGCLATPDGLSSTLAEAKRSEERFERLAGESVFIEASSDGTPLHLRLYLPDAAADATWKAPAILVMSPYFGHDAREDPMDPASEPTYFRYKWLIEHFVPRGYAVALADVRGTGDSGGCLEQTAALQTQDGYDTVEWLGTREWSNGKVGMFGKSYDAETQQATATLAPPHLATIVPVSSVSGQYEYSYYDGVPYTLQTMMSNAFYFASDGLQAPTTEKGLAAFPTRAGCIPEVMLQGADTSGDWNAFWDAREIRSRAENVTTSVLYVHGLQDWNVKPVAIRDWFDRLEGPKRAILGQWAHDYPEENRFNREWSRTDWRDTVHAWYDHWLLGMENGIMDALPPVQVQDSAGAWRREETFPPTDATPFLLHLAPGGALAATAPATGEARFIESLSPLVRQFVSPPVVPAEEVALFESEPLARDLRVSGWPTLALTATLDREDAHFVATLYDVAPDGTATWFNRAYLSAPHRASLASPEPVPVGEPVTYAMRFFPADTFLAKGHAVRLVISGGDDWTQPAGSGFTATVALGGDNGSALTLPVVERDWDAVRLDVAFGPPVDK